MLSTLIDFPVSIPLGFVSLAGTSVSGVAMVLTKKYQKATHKSHEIGKHCHIGISCI